MPQTHVFFKPVLKDGYIYLTERFHYYYARTAGFHLYSWNCLIFAHVFLVLFRVKLFTVILFAFCLTVLILPLIQSCLFLLFEYVCFKVHNRAQYSKREYVIVFHDLHYVNYIRVYLFILHFRFYLLFIILQ